jgi:hypothetical protein
MVLPLVKAASGGIKMVLRTSVKGTAVSGETADVRY